MENDVQTVVDTAVITEIKPPSMFDVIFYNDNKTHYEFVMLLLMQLFGKDYDQAFDLTDQIHKKGRSAVATYTYEVAAAKRDEAMSTARANGHPLRVEIEPTDGDQT